VYVSNHSSNCNITMPNWKKVIVSGSDAALNSLNVTNGVTITGSLNTSGSNKFIGNQTVTGSLFTSGSNILVGSTTLTGSLNITGSTTQIGNNTLLGNTTLSGSITISGSSTLTPNDPTIKIYGDIETNGVIKFLPVEKNIDTSISASYIFVSGSTNDLYFSQNGNGYANTTRLRWLEGNLYTGLLNGGVITTQSSTVYQISSGSGIIVDLNASLSDDPYPVIQYLNWGNLSASIAPLTASYQQAFVGIDSTNNIYAQGTPFSNGQFDTIINIGNVLFQNQSTINGVKTQPTVAYGFEQAQNVFNRAFGPLKLSGYTLAPSGSSTGSLVVGSGTAYSPGSNYTIDPNEPYYTVDSGTNVSKIFRYYQSGSSWVYLTNAGAGFATIDPTQYSNNGVLTLVPSPVASRWTIQRVFWFPNSVTKAIVVYYGNAVYTSESEAIANINIEPFVEAPNTAANAIYLGAIVINGDGVFTDAADFTIVPGGLFRQVGGSGGGGSIITQTLSGLSDVLISGPTDYQPLAYSTTANKWINQSALSASLSGNVVGNVTGTASYASQALNASTASYVTLAQTASYVLQAVSASYATYANTASNILGGANNYIPVFSGSSTLLTGSIRDNRTDNIDIFTGTNNYGSVTMYAATEPRIYLSSSNNDYLVTYNSYGNSGVSYASPTGTNYLIYYTSASQTLAIQAGNSDKIIATSTKIDLTRNTIITGSLNVSNGITGSLFGTSSWALNAVTSSYVQIAQTASYVLNAVSASYAETASYAPSYLPLTGGTITGNLTVNGTASITYLNTIYETASVIYSSGSNQFGDAANDTQTLYGTVVIPTGSLTVTGSFDVLYGEIKAGRIDNTNEGGQVSFGRASDNLTGWYIDVYGNTSTPSLRFVDVSNASVRMTINGSGNTQMVGSLAVGSISPSTTAGRIDASNDVVAFSTSDIRFKENITPISNALHKLNKIGGYEFDWKNEEELVALHGFTGHDVGVIAQEIEEVLPEVVTDRDSGYKAVKYEKIVPLLIQAIKELQQEIIELKSAK
jgi:hypothetical protein